MIQRVRRLVFPRLTCTPSILPVTPSSSHPQAPTASVRVLASADREAQLKEMETMRAGLSAHLASTETALKSSSASVSASVDGGPEPITEVSMATYWEVVKGAPANQVVVMVRTQPTSSTFLPNLLSRL